jgi:glycosyltransferase involved in cell wall biosynthesis
MTTIGVDIRVLGTGRVSGVEEYTEQLLSHMTGLQSGVQWKLFYSGRTPLARRSWMERPGVSVHEVRRSNRLLWLSTRAVGRPLLDEVVGGADVFFFPHFLLGALSSRCRRVMTWHDLSYERMPYLLSPYRRFWHAVQMRPRQQAQAADRIIAVSESTAADVAKLYGVDRGRIAVVHSGIDPALRRAGDEAVRLWRIARGIEAPFVLALGTREPRKNLPSLIRAWDIARRHQSVRSTHLVLAGQSGWKEGELRRAIASVHAPQDIHIIDDVDRHERQILLSAASVLVYPSLMEGFGFPPLEAMACGTPVIASATSSLIETVGDAGILVDPYRVDGIAMAIRSLMTDAGLRSRLVARGYEQSRRFSWQRAAEQTLSEINAVL